MAQVLHRLECIEIQQDEVIHNLNKEWKCCVHKVVKQLTAFLSSAAVKAHFTSWTTVQAPKVQCTWGRTQDQITKLFENRLLRLIEKWEEDNRVFATALEFLLRYFEHHFNPDRVQLLRRQIDVTDDTPSASNYDSWEFLLATILTSAAVGGILAGPQAAITLPLLTFSVLPRFGLLAEWYEMRTYEQDPSAFMALTSAEYLAAFTHEDKLTQLVKNKLKEAELLKTKIEADIPGMTQADKKLYVDLKAEKRSKCEIQRAYEPLIDEGHKLRGNLTLFGIKECFASDIECEDLTWKEDKSSLLGSGAFGTVYQGVMRRHGPVQTVALKVCRKEFNTSNAHFILQEVKNLR